MPKRAVATWVIVADGARARVMNYDRAEGRLEPILKPDFTAPEVHGYSRDLKSDKPGRAFGPAGRRGAMEPHHDFHRFQKRQFAKKMAELLNVAAQAQRFGRLILVAPPKALGDLRAELSEGARALVVHEIHKDLTRLELPKLEEQIQTVVP